MPCTRSWLAEKSATGAGRARAAPAPGVPGGEPGEGLAQQLVARLTPLHQGPATPQPVPSA